MLQSLSLRIPNVISTICRPIFLGNRLFKNEDKKSGDTTEPPTQPPKKIVLTEDQPPIPPNLGWPGDDNVRTLFEIKRISQSFKYGQPPLLGRRFNPGPRVIRLVPITHCSNRHFFRFALTRLNHLKADGILEDLGSVDPLPNRDNKILVALNIERIKYHLGKQVPVVGRASQLLGLAGLLPVHPRSYLIAYRNRKAIAAAADAQQKSTPPEEQAAQKQAITNS